MIQFLHDAARPQLEMAAGAAILGMLGLWSVASHIRSERSGKRFRPDLLQKAIDEGEDADETAFEGAQPTFDTAQSYGRVTPLRFSFALVCIVAVVAGTWFATKTYIILQYWNSGEMYMAGRDYAAAEAQYRRAAQLDPDNNKSHLRLAKALLGLSNPAAAVSELILACRGETAVVEPHVLLADTLQAIGKPSRAIPYYEQAIAIDPKDANTYTRLGICMVTGRRTNDGIKELKYALVLDPKNVQANTALGHVLLAAGNKEEGIVYLKRAVQLAPANVTVHNNLGCGYADSKMYGEAIQEFRKELTFDPGFAIGYLNLGRALQAAGDTKNAIDAYRTCLRNCGNDPDAQFCAPAAYKELEAILRVRDSHVVFRSRH